MLLSNYIEILYTTLMNIDNRDIMKGHLMNVLVLNGSPKGDYSTTLQTCLYIKKHNPSQDFTVLNVGSEIRKIEKDFSAAAGALTTADLIIFAYPVYTFIAPSQLHRFVELMKLNNTDISGKFVTQITTSKHFYDITAHRYIEDNMNDLKAKYIKGLSADMDDLLTEKGQKEALNFFDYVLNCIQNDLYEPDRFTYNESKHVKVTIPTSASDQDIQKTINIVADLKPDDTQLKSMIDRFMAVSKYKCNLINIAEFPFKGGCISCFNCATDGKCIYKDGFDAFLRENIQTGNAIVIAFSIKDHSMGTTFKTYDDRQFCNGHRTVTMGMPFGYLVSGNLSEEENLRTIINARAEVGGNFLSGVANDEFNPDSEIDMLSSKLTYAIENNYVQPSNFYGVGGMKIFRDLIYLMQGMMKADHKFYKSHGQYDFPQKKKGTLIKMYLVGALISNPKIKAKMGNKMNEGMIGPYKKVIDEK